MFLAIDSSVGTQVALVDPSGVTLAQAVSDDPRGHAEMIGLLLERVFAEADVLPHHVTHVVMGIGPGPFTGLRVGMAAASAFALSQGVPLLPVVSHDAWGYESETDVVVVTDARRGEVAYSVYRVAEAQRRSVGPALSRPENLAEALGGDRDLPRNVAEHIPADSLARVAREYLQSGRDFPAPTPRYLRQPDVSTPQ
jgi:tRNA threonylcarbamoyl adenosine modification protein YeaZ